MFGSIDPKVISEVLDFTRCQRPDGSTYGTAGQCRKGVEVKMPKPPGVGPMAPSSVALAKESAKSYGGRWREDKEDRVFDEVFSKAETVKHLGSIAKAVQKAMDEGDIDITDGAFIAMKKSMAERLKIEGRSSEGAKRERELREMTPEQRRRAKTAEAIQRGIKAGVVRSR